MSMDKKQRRQLSGNIAGGIGEALGQTYEKYHGDWWLFTAGKPMRPLKPDEIEWHVERRHKPFVEEGIDKDDPRWWDDPQSDCQAIEVENE